VIEEKATRLSSALTEVELFALKDRLGEEASRLAREAPTTREGIRRQTPEEFNWWGAVIENYNATVRALQKVSERQGSLAEAGEDE